MNRRAKRRLALLVGLIALIALLLLAAMKLSSWNRQRRVVAAKIQGMAAYEKGDYAAALNPLSFALANDRNDLELALALADTRIRNTDDNGKYLFASERYYNFALTLDPDNMTALQALFEIYVITNQPLKALRAAEKLPEDDAKTHQKRAIAQLRLGDTSAALDSIERIREIAPEERSWPIREYKIRSVTLDASAEEIYETFLAYSNEYPDNQSLELVLIEAMDRSGRKVEAKQRLSSAASRDDIDAESVLMMISMMEDMGMKDESRLLESKTVEMSLTNPVIANARIEQLWEGANLQAALNEATESDGNFPETIVFARLMACIAALDPKSKWDFENYVDPWIQRSLRIDSSKTGNERVLAEALVAYRNDPKESGPIMRKAIALFQNDETTLRILKYMLGRSQEAAGDLSGAISTYEAMEAQKRTYISGIALALAHYRSQNFERGITRIESVLRNRATTKGLQLYARMLLEGDEKFIYGLESKRRNLMRVIEQFIDSTDQRDITAASALMPAFTSLAIQDGDGLKVRKALDWAMSAPDVPLNVLVEMARMDIQSESDRLELIALIESRTESQYEVPMLNLEIQDDKTRGSALYLELAQSTGSMPSSTVGYQSIQLRMLRELLRLDFEEEFRLLEFRRILGLIPDSLPASRLIATYPNIWISDRETAEEALANIVRLSGDDSPETVTAKVIRASSLDDLETSERASLIIRLDEIIKKSPGSIDALVLMSGLLQKGNQNDLEGAALYLRKAIDLRPGLSSLYPGMIELLRKTGNGSLALEYLSDYKNARIFTLRESRTKAGVLVKEGEYRSALDELRELAEKSEGTLDYLSLAQFQASRELFEEAMSSFNRILENEPGNSIAILGKSMVLAAMNREEEAVLLLQEMEEIEPGERFRYMALVSRTAGSRESELRNIQRMLEIAPENVLNILVAAESYQKAGMKDERKAALRKIMRLQPKNLEVLIMLANEMVENQPDNPELDGLLSRISEVRPSMARVLRLVADSTEHSSGKLEPSDDQVDESSRMADDLINMYEAQRVAWLIHTSKGMDEEAYRIAMRTYMNHPTMVDPIYWATKSALRAGMYQEAVEISEIGLARIPENQRLAYTLEFANLCMQLGYGNRAYAMIRPFVDDAADEEALYERIRQGRNQNVTPLIVRITLLRVMLGSSRARDAAELFGPLMMSEPRLMSAWTRASRKLTIEDHRNALELIDSYLEDDELRLAHAEEVAMLAERSNAEPDARKLSDVLSTLEYRGALDDAVTLDQARFLMLQSSLAKVQGDLPEAMEKLKETTSLLADRKSASEDLNRLYRIALNNLALLQCEMNPPEVRDAMMNIEEALIDAPDQIVASLHETRASILLLDEDCEGAIKAMEAAINRSIGFEQSIEYRVSMVEILHQCLHEERAISEARTLRDYIYGSPRPDIQRINRLETLIEKGPGDEK